MRTPRIGADAIFAAVMIAAVSAHAAEPAKQRHWEVLPGHKNVLVNLTSIAPMWTGLRGARDYSVYPPQDVDQVRTEETKATIKFNGYVTEVFWIICSGFGAELTGEPQAVYLVPTKHNGPSPVLGYLPAGALENFVCPRARLKAQQPQP